MLHRHNHQDRNIPDLASRPGIQDHDRRQDLDVPNHVTLQERQIVDLDHNHIKRAENLKHQKGTEKAANMVRDLTIKSIISLEVEVILLLEVEEVDSHRENLDQDPVLIQGDNLNRALTLETKIVNHHDHLLVGHGVVTKRKDINMTETRSIENRLVAQSTTHELL